RVFWLPVHQLPDAGPNARGRPIVNWLALEEGEKVQAVVPVREYAEDQYVFFATRNGTVKKTPLKEFEYRLARGKIAINLDEGDALVNAELTDGSSDVMLFASNGKAVRFNESEVRAMGRTATGVRGIRLAEGETVCSMIVVVADGNGDILTATEHGFGKRTPVSEYPRKGRGIQGVIAIQTSERNGDLVGAVQITDRHEVLLISDGGTLVRTRASEVAHVGRNTQGVTLMRLGEGETPMGRGGGKTRKAGAGIDFALEQTGGERAGRAHLRAAAGGEEAGVTHGAPRAPGRRRRPLSAAGGPPGARPPFFLFREPGV